MNCKAIIRNDLYTSTLPIYGITHRQNKKTFFLNENTPNGKP